MYIFNYIKDKYIILGECKCYSELMFWINSNFTYNLLIFWNLNVQIRGRQGKGKMCFGDHVVNQSEYDSTLQLLWSEEKYFPKLPQFLEREYPPKWLGQLFNLAFPKGVSLPLGGSLWMLGEKLEESGVTWEWEAQGCGLSGIKRGFWLPYMRQIGKHQLNLFW